MPARSSNGSTASPSGFRLVRNILRRWPNAAAVTRSSAGRRAGASGLARGMIATTLDVTFGGWHKSPGGHVEQNLHFGEPLREHGKAPVRFAARQGGQALGHLALKHQGQALVLPGPLEPAEEERSGDVIGQVRDDLAGFLGERRGVDFEGIPGNKIKAPRISRGKLAERCETTPIPLNRNNAACPRCKQCPRQTAGAGPDLDDRGLVEPPRRPRNPTRQVEV